MLQLKFRSSKRFFPNHDMRFGFTLGVALVLSLLVVRAQATSFYQAALEDGVMYAKAQTILDKATMITLENIALYDELQAGDTEDLTNTLLQRFAEPVLSSSASSASRLASLNDTGAEPMLDDFESLGEFQFVETLELDDKTNFKMNFLGLQHPLKSYKLSSRFGWRHGRAHSGTDFSAPIGTPIYASATGRVVHSGYYSGYGLLITVDHGDGILTRYAHCSRSLVHVGQTVETGQLIGKVGNTGRSTGPHLHFEVIANGYHLNPEKYLPTNGIHTANQLLQLGNGTKRTP